MNFRSIPFILLVGLLFGLSIVVSRFAIDQFAPLPFVGLRLTIASIAFASLYLFFASLYLFMRQRFPFPRNLTLWRHALVLGIFGIAIPMGGFVVALQYQSGGVSSILVTVGPAIIVLMAHFVLPDEGLTWLKSAGVALALGGALLLTLRGETGLRDVTQANPIGYLLVILSLTCHSMSTIYVRKYAHGYNSFDITAAQIMIGAVVIMVTVWFTQGYNFGRVESSGIWALIYGGLGGTFVAFLVYFMIVQRFGATQAAMSNYIVPIVATFGGVYWLDETVTSGVFLGMVAILAGIVLINVQKPQARHVGKKIETQLAS